MAQIDFSFMGEGAKNIQNHLIMTGIIIGIVTVGSIVLFKYLNVPSFISRILTLIIVAVTFVATILLYYLPGIIKGFS